MVLLPSAGHWYAGDPDWLLLGTRALGAAGMIGSLALLDWVEEEEDEDEILPLHRLGVFTAFGGAGCLMAFGGVVSISTSRRAVQRHNDALYLAPFAGKESAGLSLVGTF
jgi:hypothetical protein